MASGLCLLISCLYIGRMVVQIQDISMRQIADDVLDRGEVFRDRSNEADQIL